MSTAETIDAYGFDDPLTTELYEDGLDENEEPLAQDSPSDLSIISQYHKEVRKIPILDPISTTRLAELVQQGANAQDVIEFLEFAEIPLEDEVEQIRAMADAKDPAVEMMVYHYLRFAADVARRSMGWLPKGMDRSDPEARHRLSGARIKDLSTLAGYPLPYLDRVQAANQGLRRAAEKYRPGRGAMFTTYAMHWMESFIENAVQEDRNIRIPPHILPKLGQAEKILAESIDADEPYGHSYWNKLAQRQEAHHLLNVANVVSLNHLLEESQSEHSITDEDQSPNIYETIDAAENLPLEEDPEEHAEQAILQQKIAAVLEDMPERERLVLEHRYDFVDGRTFTLEEIGQMLDITRERVRQLEQQALTRMGSRLYDSTLQGPSNPREVFTEKRLKFIDDKLYLAKLHAIRLAIRQAKGLDSDVEGAYGMPTVGEVKEHHQLYSFIKDLYLKNPELLYSVEHNYPAEADQSSYPVLIESKIKEWSPVAGRADVDALTRANFYAKMREIADRQNLSALDGAIAFDQWLRELMKTARLEAGIRLHSTAG